MDAFARLTELNQALSDEHVDYVLFGGPAVNLHGIPCFTEDIDLFISPASENVERLRQALRRLWQDAAIDDSRAEDLRGEYALVRYGTPDGFAIDLVSRIGEAFTFDDIESEVMPVGDVRIRVATPRMLYRMKRHTSRPIVQGDALDPKAKFQLEDD
jgi:hypothetical protein